jgi:hypothetical protein
MRKRTMKIVLVFLVLLLCSAASKLQASDLAGQVGVEYYPLTVDQTSGQNGIEYAVAHIYLTDGSRWNFSLMCKDAADDCRVLYTANQYTWEYLSADDPEGYFLHGQAIRSIRIVGAKKNGKSISSVYAVWKEGPAD